MRFAEKDGSSLRSFDSRFALAQDDRRKRFRVYTRATRAPKGYQDRPYGRTARYDKRLGSRLRYYSCSAAQTPVMSSFA